MIGAGDLNNEFQSFAKGILRNELYLENGGLTIDSIISAEVMSKSETDTKRSFQYNDNEEAYTFRIRGLRERVVTMRESRITSLFSNSEFVAYQSGT